MALECCRQTRGLRHHATTWASLYNSIIHTHTHTHTGGRAVRTTSPKASNDLHPPGPPCPNGTGGPIGTVPLPETNLSCSRAPSQTPPARHHRTRTQTDGGGGTPRKSLGGVRRACLLADGHTKATHTPPPPKPSLLQNRRARTYPTPPRTRPQPDPAPPAPRAPAGERGPSGPNWRSSTSR